MMWVTSSVLAAVAAVAVIFSRTRAETAIGYALLLLSMAVIAPVGTVLPELIASTVLLACVLWNLVSIRRAKRHETPGES
jgi:hypothetical protein